MANRIISPYEQSKEFLESVGVDFDKVYNDSGGRNQAQLSILLKIPNLGKELAANAYKTIKRFNDSNFANAEGTTQKEVNAHYNWEANIEQTLVGTTSTALMDAAVETSPNQLIKWLPSTAKEENVEHALQYGRTMQLKKARDLGLGVRYICQCSFEVVNEEEQLNLIFDEV